MKGELCDHNLTFLLRARLFTVEYSSIEIMMSMQNLANYIHLNEILGTGCKFRPDDICASIMLTMSEPENPSHVAYSSHN